MKPGIRSALVALLLTGLVTCSGKKSPTQTEDNGFRVISTTPADKSVNVAVGQTFQIAFSAPVDTSTLGLIVAPFPAALQQNLQISADGKTLSSNVTLKANTAYTAIIYHAVDKDGNAMETPLVLKFTTGSAFPTGKISGSILFLGGDPQNSLVGLLSRNPLTILLQPNPGQLLEQSVVGAALAGKGGVFTIENVPPGTYYIAATKDVNNNGKIDTQNTGSGVDGVGMYTYSDNQGNTLPDSVTIAAGQEVKDISVLMALLGKRSSAK